MRSERAQVVSMRGETGGGVAELTVARVPAIFSGFLPLPTTIPPYRRATWPGATQSRPRNHASLISSGRSDVGTITWSFDRIFSGARWCTRLTFRGRPPLCRESKRRMLDRIGDEVARATSIVRDRAWQSVFATHARLRRRVPGARRCLHGRDGDYPAGTYVRNPSGPLTRLTPRRAARSSSSCASSTSMIGPRFASIRVTPLSFRAPFPAFRSSRCTSSAE